MHRTLVLFTEAEPALLLVFFTNLAWRRSFLSAQQRTAAHSSANNTYVTDHTYVGEFHDWTGLLYLSSSRAITRELDWTGLDWTTQAVGQQHTSPLRA